MLRNFTFLWGVDLNFYEHLEFSFLHITPFVEFGLAPLQSVQSAYFLLL